MAKCVVYYGLSILFGFVLQGVAQYACSNPGITYTPSETAYEYQSSTNAFLTCGLETLSPRWWTSNDPCGPFTNSTLCPNRLNSCQFNITDAGDNLYHCCTTENSVEGSVADVAHLHCILLRVCTSVDLTQTSLPPVAFFGLNLVLYIAIHSSPQPNSILMVQLEGHDSTGIGKLIHHSLLSPPLLIYEFNILVPEAEEVDNNKFMVVTVQFSSPNDISCAGTRTITHYVFLKTREIPTPPMITSAAGTAVVSRSMPTGLGFNESCRIRIGSLASIAVLAVLVFLLFVLLLVGVLGASIFYRRREKSRSEDVRYNQLNGVSPDLRRNVIQSPSSHTETATTSLYCSISASNSLFPSQNGVVAETPPPLYPATPTGSTVATTQQSPPPLPGSRTYLESTATHRHPISRLHPSELSIAPESHGRHYGQTPLIEFTPDQPPTSDEFLPQLTCPKAESAASETRHSRGSYAASSKGGRGGGGDVANGGVGSVGSGGGGASAVCVDQLYSSEIIRQEANQVNLVNSTLDSHSHHV